MLVGCEHVGWQKADACLRMFTGGKVDDKI